VQTPVFTPITSHVNETAQNNFYGVKGAAMLNSPPSSVLHADLFSVIECARSSIETTPNFFCYICSAVLKVSLLYMYQDVFG
jgi:hypothetical protein